MLGPKDRLSLRILNRQDSLRIRILNRHHPAVRTSRRLAIIAVPMKMILRIMMQKAMLRKMKLACRSHKSI